MEFTTRLELHSQTTRLVEGASHGAHRRPHTGLSPSAVSSSKELGPTRPPRLPLQITTRKPKAPDFKFELLPLHSPLLGQSRLVSFPPLIDMLKFSGYPRLIRGQTSSMLLLRSDRSKGREARPPSEPIRCDVTCVLLRSWSGGGANAFQTCLSGKHPDRHRPTSSLRLEFVMALEQACLPEYREAQCAFKDSMTH